MTEYAYDPDLPFAIVSDGGLRGRSKFAEEARVFAQYYIDGQVIDTTPKPKIPADAEYVYWRDEDDQPYFARKDKTTNLWETDEGYLMELGFFLIDIGDAEVTVLVPKEDS